VELNDVELKEYQVKISDVFEALKNTSFSDYTR
jgi:hypothetical protein